MARQRSAARIIAPNMSFSTGENGGEKVGHGSGGMSPLRAAQ
jgi:hypothetical protein